MTWIVCDQQGYFNNFFIKFFYKALKSQCCKYLAIAIMQYTYYEDLQHNPISHQNPLADIQVVYEDTRRRRHLYKSGTVE